MIIYKKIIFRMPFLVLTNIVALGIFSSTILISFLLPKGLVDRERLISILFYSWFKGIYRKNVVIRTTKHLMLGGKRWHVRLRLVSLKL